MGKTSFTRGVRWRIGNREKIHIYKDNWIPRPKTFKPLFTQNLSAEATVLKLINIQNQ